ncbi:nuclear GTP-binding protein [Sarotherodon galilaeus]
MSTLGRKSGADIWTHFTFDVNENKTLCKPCGATLINKITSNLYTLYFSQLIDLGCKTKTLSKNKQRKKKSLKAHHMPNTITTVKHGGGIIMLGDVFGRSNWKTSQIVCNIQTMNRCCSLA